jgi:ribosome assembly protein RRB1
MEFRSVPHFGGVNRVRVQPIPPSAPAPKQYHAATWAETGNVHIWDVRALMESLDTPGYQFDKARVRKPVFTINSHGRAEGFAMDWASSGGTSSPSELRLLTGDIHSKIYLTTTTPSGFISHSQAFSSHTSSVEDLQWSPSESTIFASCSADRSIQIWDVRSTGRSAAGMDMAHDSDVNVISWNKTTDYLLLSGGDEGGIKVWDLRHTKKRGCVSKVLVRELPSRLSVFQNILTRTDPSCQFQVASSANNIDRMASDRRLDIRGIRCR